MKIHLEPWIATVLEGESMRDNCTNINGLRFYTPDNRASTVLTVYERFEAMGIGGEISVVEDEPDGVYALTPNGLVAFRELLAEPPLLFEADLRHARDRD